MRQDLTLAYTLRRLQPTGVGVTAAVGTAVASGAVPAPGRPNEPTGMTLLTERGFAAVSEDGWSTTKITNLSIVTDATAPQSPSAVGAIRYQTTLTKGTEPIVVAKTTGSGTTLLYLDCWFQYDTNWWGDGSGVNKIFHLWNGGGGGTGTTNRIVLAAFGAHTNNLKAQLRLQSCDTGTGVNTAYNPTHSGTFNLDPNVDAAAAQIHRGQWHRWTYCCQLNTPGVADGWMQWWLDGTLVGSYGRPDSPSGATAGVSILPATASRRWYEVQLAPTYGGTAEQPPYEQYLYVDHIYVSLRA
jgi:hypothetical protein